MRVVDLKRELDEDVLVAEAGFLEPIERQVSKYSRKSLEQKDMEERTVLL